MDEALRTILAMNNYNRITKTWLAYVNKNESLSIIRIFLYVNVLINIDSAYLKF